MSFEFLRFEELNFDKNVCGVWNRAMTFCPCQDTFASRSPSPGPTRAVCLCVRSSANTGQV